MKYNIYLPLNRRKLKNIESRLFYKLAYLVNGIRKSHQCCCKFTASAWKLSTVCENHKFFYRTYVRIHNLAFEGQHQENIR